MNLIKRSRALDRKSTWPTYIMLYGRCHVLIQSVSILRQARGQFLLLLTVQVVASLGRPLVPWSIIELNDEEVTFTVLFERIQAGSFDIIEVSDDLKRAQLSRTFVGSKRDALMTIGNDHIVLRVCSQFGNYLKFAVDISVSPPNPTATAVNAFAVMAAAQRRQQLGDNGLPFPQPVRDGRDRMYNNLIDLMREMGIKWSDPMVYGVPFLQALRDALWYVYGHHDTIAEKAPKIPELFAKRFVGYNCPESHKHRKRAKGNLSRSELSRHGSGQTTSKPVQERSIQGTSCCCRGTGWVP